MSGAAPSPPPSVQVELVYAGNVSAVSAVVDVGVKVGWSGLGASSDARVQLGEGSLWDGRTHTLYFIDILGRKLHALSYQAAAADSSGNGSGASLPPPRHREWSLPSRPGTVVLTRRPEVVLLCCQDGLHYLNTADGSLLYSGIRADPDEAEHRCNDGKTDPSGRLVVGTMHLDEGDRGAEKGTLYRLDASGQLTPLLKHLSIPNGLAWSKDGTRFWHTDVHQTDHTRTHTRPAQPRLAGC